MQNVAKALKLESSIISKGINLYLIKMCCTRHVGQSEGGTKSAVVARRHCWSWCRCDSCLAGISYMMVHSVLVERYVRVLLFCLQISETLCSLNFPFVYMALALKCFSRKALSFFVSFFLSCYLCWGVCAQVPFLIFQFFPYFLVFYIIGLKRC